jgi:hypothetical protein
VCPDGFFYAGDDSKRLRDFQYEEVERSPVYSCYKIVRQQENW